MKKKLLIIAGNARSLHANRRDLIDAIKKEGWSVEALVPSADFQESVYELDIPIHKITLTRTGINPLADLALMFRMRSAIRGIKPDVVFSYNIKPVIFGTMAAKLARVPVCYSMVTGLGYVYTTRNLKTKVLKSIVSWLYRFSFRLNKKIFFQNPDDIAEFRSFGILRERDHVVRTHGSGIALDRFPVTPLPDKHITFLFIGRLLTEKGVKEFCEAAKIVRKEFPESRFIAVGPLDTGLPHSVSERDYQRWIREGNVEFVGGVSDVKPYIASSHVFVLPSYREGTPRSVLEAMSMRRAIITSDAPGCRETVMEGENGFLVPVGDIVTLASRMKHFLQDPALCDSMGERSRELAEQLYDVNKVNAHILSEMSITKP